MGAEYPLLITLNSGITFDSREEGLIVITWPETTVSEEGIREYVQQLDLVFARGEFFRCVIDLSHSALAGAHQRSMIGTWAEDNKEVVRKHLKCTYYVSSSLIVRLAVRTFSVALGTDKILGPVRTFSTLEEAVLAARLIP